MALIRAENVVKEYKMEKVTVKALRGVSLEINQGDFAIIIGPSGSGKSTLMHLLGALDTPTSGKIYIDDKDISKMNPDMLSLLRRKKIGFIFQNFNLIPTLTALENVMIPTEPMNVSKIEVTKKAMDLLKLVGLGDRVYHKPNELSGGQRQRVSIARSLINDPEIILADEPTGNLDSITGDQIIELMCKLNKEGKTFILVTHDRDLLDIANKKFFLKDGLIEKISNGNGKTEYAASASIDEKALESNKKWAVGKK